MRRICTFTLILATVFVLLTGCGVGSSNSPGDGAREQLELATTGEWDRVYQQLHPDQQEVVTRDAFLACNTGNTMTLGKVSIASEQRITRNVPELGDVKVYEVTLDATVNGQPVERVSHVIRKGSEWRWVLDQQSFDAYRDGRCPPTS